MEPSEQSLVGFYPSHRGLAVREVVVVCVHQRRSRRWCGDAAAAAVAAVTGGAAARTTVARSATTNRSATSARRFATRVDGERKPKVVVSTIPVVRQKVEEGAVAQLLRIRGRGERLLDQVENALCLLEVYRLAC
jgi:hypothetical protein